MANKKINQLVSKTAILSTDIFGIGDATTGQLFKKTIAELQAAIGGAVISVNGLVGTVVLDTDDIQELATPTNKYFTDARARGAISLTVTGNSGASAYSSGTGVLNVPTYTLAGLGGITATFLSGTSGISYNSTTGVISYSGTVYTDASIRALLSAGTGITYNSTTGAISYSGTVYTDASIRALISLTTTGTSGASTYNNTTGVINVPNYTLAGLGGISLTSLSGGTGITYNNTTGAISYSGTVYTDASVRALISASGAVSYNNTTGVISLTSGNLTEATSSVLTITGGTGAVLGSGTSIQVKQASTTISGFLSSTDWNTFNGKASALSGTTNYVAKFTSSTAIGNSIIFDNGANVGIGNTANATRTLDVTQLSSYVAGIRISAGSGATAKIQFFGDGASSQSDIGPSVASPNDLIFGVGGSERFRINAIGNLGVGVTPSSWGSIFRAIQVGISGSIVAATSSGETDISLYSNLYYDGTNYKILNSTNQVPSYLQLGDGALSLLTGNTGSVGSNITGLTTKFLITKTGSVGIGITPAVKFEISGSNNEKLVTFRAPTGILQFYPYFSTYGGAIIQSLNSAGDTKVPLRIEASFTTITGTMSVNTGSDNGYTVYVNGTIYATSNITANSDLTLKKNLAIIENPTDKLMQLNGYSYQWKSDDSHQYGVIAQEVEKILPYAVSTGNDGIKGVSYNQIIPVLIEAVKEQKKELEELRDILASK